MINRLIADALKELPLDLRAHFTKQLEGLGKDALFTQISKTVAQALLKGIDGVIVACVRTLGKGDSHRVVDAYTLALQEQIQELAKAIADYAPKQLNVELAKATYGEHSREANQARLERSTYLNEVRAEIGDLLKVATGGTPGD